MAKERFTSPVGRLLQGSVDEPQTKDMQGRPRVVKSGPNAGQPNPQFYIGIAVAKNDPAWPPFWASVVAKAAADFPALFPQGPQPHLPTGGCVRSDFAYKIIDGDSTAYSQATPPKRWCDYENFPGHFIVRFASAYPPRCFYAGKYAANEQIQEKNVIRRGYYVRVSGSMEGNGDQQKPGLYLNLDMVELSGYGPEIQSGPDAGQAFGATAAALPPGASPSPATPPAGAPGAPAVPFDPTAAALADGWVVHPTSPGYYYRGQEVVAAADLVARYPAPAAPPLPVAPPVAPASPAVASPAPASPPVAPYTGYMGNAPSTPAPTVAAPPSPAPPPSAPPAIPSPTRAMTAAANGATYEQMIAAGWTDDTLRAHGMMQ